MSERKKDRPAETVEEASRSSTRYMKRNLLWTLLLVAAFLIWSAVRGGTMSVELGGTALKIVDPEKETLSIDYADMVSLSVETGADYGEPAGGTRANGCWYGAWHNGAWGDYTLCVHPKVGNCLVIVTAQSVTVINGSSEAETNAWLSGIQQLRGR